MTHFTLPDENVSLKIVHSVASWFMTAAIAVAGSLQVITFFLP